MEPSATPTLPLTMFTTSGSLMDSVDKKLVVVLRDGRKLIGWLRSYDQFANLILQDTVERIYANDTYGDIPRGIYLIRGENVVLLGEIDLEKEDDIPLRKIPVQDVLSIHQADQDQRQKKDKLRNKVLVTRGFSVDTLEDDRY